MTRFPGVKYVAVLALAVLAASPLAATAADPFHQVSKVSTKKLPARPLMVTMELSSQTNSHLKGELLDISDLAVETAFGTASIPLHAVAGMRLPTKDEPLTTVVLSNGDSVTGTTDLNKLFVNTDWGKAEVEATGVVSIVFKEGLTWTVEASLAGERWKLIDQAQVPQVYYQY